MQQAITGILLAMALMAADAWPAMQPARIGEHELSLANRIKFPDVTGDFTIFLRCEAKVLPGGNIDEIGCYDDENIDAVFFRAVSQAGENATVIPASVDGEPVNVLMLFSVIFRQQGDQRVVAVVPNHGTNAKDLGVSYIAPQRYGRSNVYTPRTELGLLWIDATMTPAGTPEDVKFIDTDFTNRETRRYARSYVKDCTFIPGHLNGKPIEMRFVKPIFGYRNGFMWDSDTSRCRDASIACDETSGTTGRPRFVFED